MKRILDRLESVALAALVVAGLLPAFVGAPARSAEGPETLVAWAPENMPFKTERALDKMEGVEATTVVTGIMWLKASTTPDGTVVDDPPDGYGIPMEVAFVKPKEYATYVSPDAARAISSLGGKQAVMPGGAAALRGGHDSLDLRLGRYSRRVTAIVSNEATQGYEVLMAAPPPESFDHRLRYVIVRTEAGVDRSKVRSKIEGLLAAGAALRIKAAGEVPYLRYADSVHPLWVFKRHFGEFEAIPSDSGPFSMNPSWVERHIATREVPILGSVRCHVKIFEQLNGALKEVEDKGLAGTIDRSEYAGCYVSRFVATVPGTRLSRHSWGIAVDINASSNPFGAASNQDMRMVKIFEKWGFLWGGRWPLPDAMHFEWDHRP